MCLEQFGRKDLERIGQMGGMSACRNGNKGKAGHEAGTANTGKLELVFVCQRVLQRTGLTCGRRNATEEAVQRIIVDISCLK